MKCMWCLQDHQQPSIEHIIPEALRCPPGLILANGEVCVTCNHRNGSLDRILADAFDMMRIFAGVKGKRGKPATVSGKKNLRGRLENYGGDFVINVAGPPIDDPKYGRVHPPAGGPTDVQAEIITIGQQVTVKLRTTPFSHPKLSQALHKIAFELLALSEGVEIACSNQFDLIRQFVLSSVGTRRVLLVDSDAYQQANGAPKLARFEDDTYYVSFLLFGIPFVVDLTSDQHHLDGWCKDLRRARGDSGWTVVPHR